MPFDIPSSNSLSVEDIGVQASSPNLFVCRSLKNDTFVSIEGINKV